MSFDSSYFGELRPEIVAMIPSDCKSVFDVGCGYGTLGRYLKEHGIPNVSGIEIFPEAAAEAGKVLDTVIQGNIETTSLPFLNNQFDCIVCADVLEHLVNPWKTLGSLKCYLKPGGCIVASIPNVGFHRILRGLMKGQWRYAKSGVLDRTHLRFFTLEGIESLFAENKLQIVKIDRKIDAGLNMKLLNLFLLGAIRESLVIQYIIKAVRVGQC
jgi:2-polyprenyl-3-methyl-5-hydroxy-6-metoxy-1,4-benzoquinol methylase